MKKRAKRGLLAILALVSIVAMSIIASPAASADPIGGSSNPITANMAKKHADYNIKVVNGKLVVTLAPQAYPTGCGLDVWASRPAPYLVDGDAYTGCNFTVASIAQTVTIYRSRWYGWQPVGSGSRTDFNTSSSLLGVSYNCGGTGIHNFQVIGQGTVTPYGQPAVSAEAYDEIDGVNCP